MFSVMYVRIMHPVLSSCYKFIIKILCIPSDVLRSRRWVHATSDISLVRHLASAGTSPRPAPRLGRHLASAGTSPSPNFVGVISCWKKLFYYFYYFYETSISPTIDSLYKHRVSTCTYPIRTISIFDSVYTYIYLNYLS